jgi:phosphoribosylglycinamide formyltransferase 1
VTAELDAGPILAQARVPVLPRDDVDALAARVLKEEHRIYPQALGELARSLRGPGGCERQVASPLAR